MIRRYLVASTAVAAALWQGGLAQGVAPESYDLLIRNGVIYDGSGGAPYVGDVGIKGDLIVYAGPASAASAAKTVDARGKFERAISPRWVKPLGRRHRR